MRRERMVRPTVTNSAVNASEASNETGKALKTLCFAATLGAAKPNSAER